MGFCFLQNKQQKNGSLKLTAEKLFKFEIQIEMLQKTYIFYTPSGGVFFNPV